MGVEEVSEFPRDGDSYCTGKSISIAIEETSPVGRSIFIMNICGDTINTRAYNVQTKFSHDGNIKKIIFN